ncbi:reverse transcriptase domain-containing protein [Pseudomonas fortuita]|uniref:reverse transcriptase domain-containing protein n=1 Tax=Pseudomonas fortuita TaxID=3233375 RepID=UPI003DA187B5
MRLENQYKSFTIAKKSGGVRTIYAPSDYLKPIQAALSLLLQDCIQEITKSKGDGFRSTLSHGFVRERSILTNAVMHLSQKNVLNIDLKDFFESFNFGRVRGFFIANKNFQLDPAVATVIAQIACYDNKLPQGSPCSPVITNLITHSLDIRLASLAKEFLYL